MFADNDPGGNRRIGAYWYRYFMKPGDGWWVGINSNIASAGADIRMALFEGFRAGIPGYFPDLAAGGGVRTITRTSSRPRWMRCASSP